MVFGMLWPFGFHFSRLMGWYSFSFLLVGLVTLSYLWFLELGTPVPRGVRRFRRHCLKLLLLVCCRPVHPRHLPNARPAPGISLYRVCMRFCSSISVHRMRAREPDMAPSSCAACRPSLGKVRARFIPLQNVASIAETVPRNTSGKGRRR
jgi:hypothetical protein